MALRSLEVLCDLSRVCADFVRRRVIKEVWPVVAQLLTRLAGGSRDCDSAYRFSTACRLQGKLLETAGILGANLQVSAAPSLPPAIIWHSQVSSSDLEPLVQACLPYLSSRQPPQLCSCSQETMARLISHDPDLLWLLFHQLVPMPTQTPPHPSLQTYKVL